MELFKRVEFIIEQKKTSRKAVAEALGIPQPTFGRYFSSSQQDKLAPLLWNLVELWPDVSRDWLFFEEGKPFIDDKPEWNPEYVRVGDTLHDLVPILGREKFLAAAGISESRLDALIGCRALPTAEELTAWLLKLHVSANFLLCQIGPDILNQSEFEATLPPLKKVRESFGDFDYAKKIKELEKELRGVRDIAEAREREAQAYAREAQAWQEMVEHLKRTSSPDAAMLLPSAPMADKSPVAPTVPASITNSEKQ